MLGLYSETTWGVGIALLTHHEVQGGGNFFFGPHRGPSGELIAQYRPLMLFCFYPTLYLGNYLYFLKPESSWKQQKNTWISATDSVHSTKRVAMVTPQHLLVTSWWCPSSRARQTLRIFHVGKLRPNHSCILIQESFWITIHLVPLFKKLLDFSIHLLIPA